MTDRRSGPPLFDLMREREDVPDGHQPVPKSTPAHTPHTPAKSVDHPQPSPSVSTKQTAWDSSGGVSRAERSAAAMLDGEVQHDAGIRLSSPAAYLSIAIALALIVGAWALGYQRGQTAGKAEMEQYVQDQPVVRPAQGAGSSTSPPPAARALQGAESVASTSPNKPEMKHSDTPGTTPSTKGVAGVMSPAGFLATDPRTPGDNYLVLATLSTEQATDAISFMYSHGVRVIGVPAVDSRGSGANNPSRYTLYSLGVAIPGNRWSAMSAQRSEHQQLVADLGARWQREQRGASDFSQTNWKKYEP